MSLRRMTTRLVSGLVLLASAALPLAAEAPPAKRSCEQLKEWVETHRAELPTDYAGILAYSPEERRAILGSLTPEQKMLVWRDRLDAHLAEQPKLSAGQQEAVKLATRLLTPQFFEVAWQTEAQAAQRKQELDALAGQLVRLAGKEFAQAVFFDLGPTPAAFGSQRLGGSAANLTEICNCRGWQDCPPQYTTCGQVPFEPPCSPTFGCGIFSNQECTGVCLYFAR